MTTAAEYIEIRNATDKSVAFLSPQADGLKEAYIENELNSNCSLTFQLPLTSEKWAYITDAYEFLADGKRFILLKPDTEEIVRDGEKVWGKITAQEKFVELDKEYVTISNDPNSPGPAWSAVIIVSGGTPAGGYTAGSAGSALTYLLAGSDWTLLTCDVTGTFDLETEKISLLANIQKVQELWGGFLVWDSENKTVSLRDETLWQNYNGFQVRYAKNLKGITRTVNRDLVTRLYPFGKEDLNIASVNGGVLYIDNFTYTNKIYEGQYNNQDIADATELKTKSTAELAKLCKPRYTYKITLLDLSVKPQWAHETFTLGDIADVIDADVGADDRLRIVRHKYNIFQRWKCELDIGEPLEKLSSRIADTSAVTEKVLTNTGTANILKGIINTKATEINGATGDYTLVDGVSTWFGSTGGVRDGKVTRITPNGLVISNDGAQTFTLAIDGDGIYADKIICSDVYTLSSDDGYTKMGSDGIKVYDGANPANLKAHLGQYASGKFGLKATAGLIEGLKTKWDLGAGTFRLGASDADYKMLFDGTNLLFSNDVKIQFKGDTGATGATGAQGPQGADGSYYAPAWVKSTYIDFNSIQSPSMSANQLSVGAGSRAITIQGSNSDNSIRSCIKAGKSNYGTGNGTGFWLGDYSDTWKFDIGSDTDYLRWDGSDLLVKGKFSTKTDTVSRWTDIYDAYILTKLNSNTLCAFSSSYGDSSDYTGRLIVEHHGTINNRLELYGGAGYLEMISNQKIIIRPGRAAISGYTSPTSDDYNVGIQGGLSIGNSYYYNYVPPANGVIIEGNVGIGTSTPLSTAKLHVEGTTKLNGNVGIGVSPVANYPLTVNGWSWLPSVAGYYYKIWSTNGSYYTELRTSNTGVLEKSNDGVNWTAV